ncbi:MAG TPA: FISUMP domain-containing protein [Bacteroidales bacterium]|nr:FISUMP domain-containing protein [Bacteroidales bacterium]
MKKAILFLALAMSVSFGFCQEFGSFTDTRDGKVYKTVIINQVTWLAENLAFAPDSGNYWAYDNKEKNVKKFGYLYDWETAMKSCPEGWHLPDAIEWNLLIMNNGGANAGVKLKASGAFYYDENVEYSYNESGLGILPAGFYNSEKDEFSNLKYSSIVWSSITILENKEMAYAYNFTFSTNEIKQYTSWKTNAYSVRCIKNY